MAERLRQTPAESFQQARPRLQRIAYATLGSLSEAEDVLQEAWLRTQRVDWDTIEHPEAWLSTVVGRLALDALGSARARRERYVGTWLPEPIVDNDPADAAARDEEVSIALLVVLERLSPAERSAFVLHDVFGMSFAEVASALGRTPDAVRQLASRARRRVREDRPRFEATPEEQRAAVEAFAAASVAGDLDALIAVLDPDVVMRTDGGGVVAAARRPLHGADRVGRALLALARKQAPTLSGAPVQVNGRLGILLDSNQGRSVMAFSVENGRIAAIDVIRNPDKLRSVPPLA